jgi:hypothetical protein
MTTTTDGTAPRVPTEAAEARVTEVPASAQDDRTVRIGHGALLHAVQQNMEENAVTVEIAGVGKVRLPALDSLAWLGGLATLAALGLLEWPVAAVIGVGHLLSRQRHLRLLQDFGEALGKV